MSDDFELVRGSGNVFRDFDMPNPDLEQLRAILAAQIIKALDRKRLTVRKAAELTGIAAADFSRIRIQKSLPRKSRRSIRRHPTAVAADCGCRGDKRPVIRHPELQDLVELLFRQRRGGSILRGALGADHSEAIGTVVRRCKSVDLFP